MPRRARPVLSEVPLHIIQRGNNRTKCFFGDADYLVYLDMLKHCASDAQCQVHAYVLMSNHVHLLVTPRTPRSPSHLMKSLGERYVRYVNRRYGRSGTLWEGRYRSSLVDRVRYLLICHRYIELNPVRANMVKHPSHYPWSSYRTNAHGEASGVITPHPVYIELATHPTAREIAYRDLFATTLAPTTLERVRHALNGNYALGDKSFLDAMTKAVGRNVAPRSAGRPSPG